MPDERLARLDANNDGVLTRDELAARDAKQESRMEQRTSERFAKLDQNHDGLVDAKEFQAQAATLFTKFDKNHDGTLDASELPQHHGFGRGHGDCQGHDKPADKAG